MEYIFNLKIYLFLFWYKYKNYIYLKTSVTGKKLSLSESFNDLHYVKHSKGGLAWDLVSPPRRHSPNRSPDTPNPCDKSNIDMVIYFFFIKTIFCYSLTLFKLFQSKHGSNDRCSIDSSDMRLTQNPIISMEDDEVSDQETVS